MENLKTTPFRTMLITELAKHKIRQYDEERRLYKYVPIDIAHLIIDNHSMMFSTSLKR